MKSKIWQHKITGQLYVVAVNEHGATAGACGPLQPTDIQYALAGQWDNDATDHSYVYHNAALFQDITVILENERARRLLRAAGKR
jgi:hypothetical protein